MAARKRKKSSKAKRSWAGCGCPANAVKIPTKRGRGWVCQSKTPKQRTKRGMTFVFHPFVKATCGRR